MSFPVKIRGILEIEPFKKTSHRFFKSSEMDKMQDSSFVSFPAQTFLGYFIAKHLSKVFI